MSKLELLLKRIQKPEPKVVHKAPPKTSPKLMMLLNRLERRDWLVSAEEGLMIEIQQLHSEAKWIEHLPSCRICQIEIQIDVERYLGTHIAWYCDLTSSEYLEEAYADCPKLDDYVIDNYWDQVERYRKTGTTESTEVNTLKFILDRAKWAYKVTGKQTHVARQMLKLVRNWNFSAECEQEYGRLEEEFGVYSPLFSSG